MKRQTSFLWLSLMGVILMISLLSCHKKHSADLKEALLLAGENKTELQNVLDYYAKSESDSLKWKAACFLIEHMPVHYTYHGEAVDTFYEVMGAFFKSPRDQGRPFYTAKYDSLLKIWENKLEQKKKRMDVESITADYLIRNIEEAFRMWQMPWAKHYSFEMFCEYILPYRVGKEPLSDWRSLFINRKPSELDLVKSAANKMLLYGMCNSLNEKFVANIYYPAITMPEYPLAMLGEMKSGSCGDYSAQSIAQMRALGIPVAIDFIPQWGTRSMGHEWPALVVSEQVCLPFSTNDALGRHLYVYFEEVFPKVYRKTYQRQKESLYYLSDGEEDLPELFDTPCIKDVTTQYITDTKNVEVTFFDRSEYPKFAYLSAFDNEDWKIVHWGKAKGNKVTFETMGAGCVYLPVRYRRKEITPLAWPVLCTMQGNRELIPDMDKKESLRLTRKFRYSRNLDNCAKRVKGGKFQVANNKDFSDSVTIYTISETPECAFQKVNLSYAGEYQYFRYLAPAESYCNMAEIELYDAGGTQLPTNSIFSVDGGNTGYEDYKCFDGDVLTYYNANWHPHNGWIAVEFPQPVHLSYLYYLPRNDDNFIREGELYELFYWGKRGWKSLGQKKGTKESVLIYNNAPANALFLLHNHTRGKEERIFTYKNGKQVWW